MSPVEALINLLAPHNCLACGDEGKLVCGYCRPDFCPILPPRCYKCKITSGNSLVCVKCRRESPLKHVWVCTYYTGLPKELIHSFKFDGAQAAATMVAGFMQETLPYLDNALIVPVPTATVRLRHRGYDHTCLLARQLSRLLNLPYATALARLGQSRQVGTKRAERLSQLTGAFYPKNTGLVKGAHILLVDDVVTSGATLEEAGRTLKRAGAKTVDAVVFAQK